MRDNKLPGDYTGSETPDPIPNSEAKPVGPMVVLTARVGHRQDYEPRYRKVSGLSFFMGRIYYCALGESR